MSHIKEVLKEICKEIIEQNNKPFEESEGGISNHIFDEKGVQMKIGWNLIKYLELEKDKKLNLQFEKKFFNKQLGKKDYLDIFLFHEYKRIGIELKFKTNGIHITKKVGGSNIVDEIATQERKEKFQYHFSNQGAETNGQHSFFWDLHRLNYFINKQEIDLGYQIFITNDSSYWKKKTKGSKKYIIVEQDGKLQISDEKKENNSNEFEMSHGTTLKKVMDPPNWTSIDKLKGQRDLENPQKKLQNSLDDKLKKEEVLYCKEQIKLEHLVDDKIEWLPQKIEHLGEEQDNPARSTKDPNKKFNLVADDDQQPITKFAFVIVELKNFSGN